MTVDRKAPASWRGVNQNRKMALYNQAASASLGVAASSWHYRRRDAEVALLDEAEQPGNDRPRPCAADTFVAAIIKQSSNRRLNKDANRTD